MGKKTKQKIVNTTINLLNEKGYRNTKLKDIADKQKISLGNLTYHFPKKDQLVRYVFTLITDDVDVMFDTFKEYPALADFEMHMQRFYTLQGRYKFFYTDRLEFVRDFEDLGDHYYKRIEYHISKIKDTLIYNVEKGILKSDFSVSVYDNVAETIWKTMTNHHVNSMIREGEDASFKNLSNEVWKLLLPFFTNQGLDELCSLKKTDPDKVKSDGEYNLDLFYNELK